METIDFPAFAIDGGNPAAGGVLPRRENNVLPGDGEAGIVIDIDFELKFLFTVGEVGMDGGAVEGNGLIDPGDRRGFRAA